MRNLLKFLKISVFLLVLLCFFISIPFFIYLKVIPYAVSNDKLITFVEENAAKTLGVDVNIDSPVLKTGLNTNIDFKVKEISISKDKTEYFSLKNFDSSVSFAQILEKTIILNKLGADYIFADVNKLMTLSGEQKTQQEQKPFDWTIDWFNSLLYIKKCVIVYNLDKDTSIKVDARNLEITESREPKFVRFDIAAIVKKKSHELKFFLSDRDTVYMKDKRLLIDRGILVVNKSKIFINASADRKNGYDINLYADNFDLKNIIQLLRSNLIMPNGDELLSFYKDIYGSFDFKINLNKKKGLEGIIKINKAGLKLIPVNNIPVIAQKGVITFDNKKIYLKDFVGYYGKNQKNRVEMSGTVDDYMKSVDTNIEVKGVATNELVSDYISKVAGCKLTLTGGDSGTILYVKSKYNKIDITWLFKLAKGKDILIEGASLSPVNWDRALKADFHFENNIFQIKSINYYIAQVIDKSSKGIKPLLTISGNVDCSKPIPEVLDLGFNIPKPLPSEFLNVLIGQKLFKKGTISGNMHYVVNNGIPQLKGNMEMKKVRIPSQRLRITNASFSTDDNLIYIKADGRFKRSKYNFNGHFKNSLILPVVVKDINLTIDNIDVEKMILSMNQQNTNQVSTVTQKDVAADSNSLQNDNSDEDESSYDAYTFDTGLIVVERCILHVVKGFYKDIKFGNLWANLTLDGNGLLQIKSNKFDFAEGTSSLKVLCDLKKHIYSLTLGVKDINSDLIATTLLALKREITGKASGLIEINTDDSLKLSGRIQFIVKNGTIAKVGLVEYALKFAALFRNPMAMISPSTIFDLVNVPEGDFDKIVGDIVMKDNIVEKIMIKSSAAQLSSFIIGRFDLETRDASLRIYTKFSNKNKGFAGFLRNFSLNSLANRVPLNSRNDSLYYSAELSQLPPIDAEEKDCQVFLTKVDGDVEKFNFLSSLKKIK